MRDYTVRRYKFSELSPEAQAKAVEKEVEAGGEYLPEGLVTGTMLSELFYRLNPEYDGDPETDTLKIVEWDLYRQEIGFEGTVNREQAPALPWPDGAAKLTLDYSSYGGHVVTLLDDEGDEVTGGGAMLERWRDIKSQVLRAGQEDYDYLTGEELARENLTDNNEDKYTEDGDYSPL